MSSVSAISDKVSEAISFPTANNFEWLRLIFALQVVISHASSHLPQSIQIPALIGNFPGVPAFFFVSGFLIYSSYLNASGKRYFQNRFLRLFPALVMVTLGGGLIMILGLSHEKLINNYPQIILWFISQVTIGQGYNPDLYRGIGVGVINGSLWTITVEILFYIFVPLLVWLQKYLRYVLELLILFSFILYALGPSYLDINVYRNKSIFDLLALTPVVWGWMFGFGILAVKYFNNIKTLLNYAPYASAPLILMIIYGDGIIFSASGNRLGLLYFICYAAIILWVAFSLPKVPLPFDFSYGMYIWHMPIINLLLIVGLSYFSLAIGLTFFTAALSWYLVEKPMLKRKRKSLRPIERIVHFD